VGNSLKSAKEMRWSPKGLFFCLRLQKGQFAWHFEEASMFNAFMFFNLSIIKLPWSILPFFYRKNILS